MIPKIIHYCWFGENSLTDDAKQYINTWKAKCPEYQIIEWNETNFDIEINQYVNGAYKNKKWAFVSDYVRLYVLYNYGGIYLDTDVEILKSFDKFLDCSAFIGAESEYSVCTATIGSVPKSKFIKDLLDIYAEKKFILDNGVLNEEPNSQMIFRYLVENYEYESSNIPFITEDCIVYPCDYFSPLNCYTMKINKTLDTHSIHHYAGTWKSKKTKMKDIILILLTRVIGEENRELIKRCIKGRK